MSDSENEQSLLQPPPNFKPISSSNLPSNPSTTGIVASCPNPTNTLISTSANNPLRARQFYTRLAKKEFSDPAGIQSILQSKPPPRKNPSLSSHIAHFFGKFFTYNPWIAVSILVIHLSILVAVYCLAHDQFKGDVVTYPLLDGIYYGIVTFFTVGYGDWVPNTTGTKLFICGFVLINIGIMTTLANLLFAHFLDLNESMILKCVRRDDRDFDEQGFPFYIKLLLGISGFVVVIAAGTLAVFFFESLNLVDSLYLTIMTISTVGYGDKTFKSAWGRGFASVWVLLSISILAKASLYFGAALIEKRRAKIKKMVLQGKFTAKDFAEGDGDKDLIMSKSDYILLKLKKMGTINEHQINYLSHQFDHLGLQNRTQITVEDLPCTIRVDT